MTERATAAERVAAALRDRPRRRRSCRSGCGSGTGRWPAPTGAPTVVVRSRRALRRLLWAPGELGLARAYVAGELDVEGDLCDGRSPR